MNSLDYIVKARREAAARGLGKGWQPTAMILAGWCAALGNATSRGYVRAGLPPVRQPDDPGPPDNPTLLEGER